MAEGLDDDARCLRLGRQRVGITLEANGLARDGHEPRIAQPIADAAEMAHATRPRQEDARPSWTADDAPQGDGVNDLGGEALARARAAEISG